MPCYWISDPDFTLPFCNPFSSDGKYGEDWVLLQLFDSANFQMMTGTDRIFHFKLSRQCDGWQYRWMDFLNYQSEYQRNVIVLSSPADAQEVKAVYGQSSIRDPWLRGYEPRVLVHSTTREAVPFILADGFLSSWNRLKQQGRIVENHPIGRQLGDPADFRDFVMLGSGVAPEIVVNSKLKGLICMDTASEYTHGARWYFDMQAVANDGLLVRDGAHYKVKDLLPLRYALFCATLETVDMQGEPLTPATFARRADEAFERQTT